MVDWTSGTNDASVEERDSGFVIVRIPGTTDVLKEAAVSGFVTKDAGGNLELRGNSVGGVLARLANNSATGFSSITFEDSTDVRGQIWAGNLSYAAFGGAGSMNYSANSGPHVFYVNYTERLRCGPTGHLTPGVTDVQDIGVPGLSWNNGFIRNAWTVTSDADLKQRGVVLSDNEILAGKRIADELVWWKWLKSIADKGAAARNHFGPMAQDIAQILVECDVELDWADGKPSFRSDMLCWDEWDAVTQPVMAERIVQKTKIVLVPVDGSDDGTGEPFYKREEITVDEVEQYDTGAVEIVRPAGSGWRIDPSQVAFFLIAAINADTERRLALLEGPKS
jgi:hypothetical protein